MKLYYNLPLRFYTELLIIGGSARRKISTIVKYRSFCIEFLTEHDCKRRGGHCLAGSLTGEVACERVSQARNGILGPDGNRTGSAMA